MHFLLQRLIQLIRILRERLLPHFLNHISHLTARRILHRRICKHVLNRHAHTLLQCRPGRNAFSPRLYGREIIDVKTGPDRGCYPGVAGDVGERVLVADYVFSGFLQQKHNVRLGLGFNRR